MGKGMKAGKRPKMAGPSRERAQMQQVQMLQAQMGAIQEEIEKKETSASSGGGAVEATVNGKKELVSIKIKPEAVDPEDVETLEDLVLTAVNEALRQMEEISSDEMSAFTSGLGLPPGLL